VRDLIRRGEASSWLTKKSRRCGDVTICEILVYVRDDEFCESSMATPEIKVLGVYRLDVTEDIFREQFSTLYHDVLQSRGGPDIPDRATAESYIRAQLESVVLIELLVMNRDQRFSMDDFIQEDPTIEEGGDQAAWAEAFLMLDGSSLAVERNAHMPNEGDL